MAISKNGSWATNEASSVQNITVSHTLGSGSNRVVLIFVSEKDNNTWATQPLGTDVEATDQVHNAHYPRASGFKCFYDNAGTPIPAELLYSYRYWTQNGYLYIFAVWEDDLPAGTGAKDVHFQSIQSTTAIKIAVIQYDNVLQRAHYAEKTGANSTSFNLQYITSAANCLAFHFIGIDDTTASGTTITPPASVTAEVTSAWTHDAAYDSKAAIYSISESSTGTHSYTYTLSDTLNTRILSFCLIPDTETHVSAKCIKIVDHAHQFQITASSANPSVSINVPSGSNRIALAFLYWDDTASHTIDTATFGGQSMTKLGQAGNTTGDTYVAAWYLLDANFPSTGTQTLTITNPSTIDNWICSIVILDNIEQEAPNNFTSDAQTASAATHTIDTGTAVSVDHALTCALFGISDNVIHRIDEGMYYPLYSCNEADAAEAAMLTFAEQGSFRTENYKATRGTDVSKYSAGLVFWLKPKQALNLTQDTMFTVSPVYYDPQLNQNLDVSLVSVSPAYYDPQINQQLDASFVTISPVFYGIDVKLQIDVPLISFSPVYYQHTLDTPQDLNVSLIVFNPTYYDPNINQQLDAPFIVLSPVFYGADITQDIDVPLIVFNPTYYDPQINQKIDAPFIEITPVFYSATVSSVITLQVPFLEFTPIFYTHSINYIQNLNVPLIELSPEFYSPRIVIPWSPVNPNNSGFTVVTPNTDTDFIIVNPNTGDFDPYA